MNNFQAMQLGIHAMRGLTDTQWADDTGEIRRVSITTESGYDWLQFIVMYTPAGGVEDVYEVVLTTDHVEQEEPVIKVNSTHGDDDSKIALIKVFRAWLNDDSPDCAEHIYDMS